MDTSNPGNCKLQEFWCDKILVKYNCKYCDFLTDLRITLNEHVGRRHIICFPNNDTDLQIKVKGCGNCNFISYSILVWRLHQKKCTYVSEEANTCSEAASGSTQSSFTKQITKEKLNGCNYSDETVSKTSDKKRCTIPKEAKLFECEQCEYKAKRMYQLNQHFNVRHDRDNMEQFKCKHCFFKSVHKTSLKRHTNLRHAVEPKRFKCDWCRYKTKREEHLQHHINTNHNSENLVQYKCNQSTYRPTFKQHMNVHDTCFEKKESLKYNSKQKLFQCDQCEYRGKREELLRRHINVKQTRINLLKMPFKCTHCSFKTVHKDCLRKHINLQHINNFKRFQCDQCGFKTKRKDNLRSHVNYIHNFENLVEYKCSRCPWRSFYKAHLKRHMTVHL